MKSKLLQLIVLLTSCLFLITGCTFNNVENEKSEFTDKNNEEIGETEKDEIFDMDLNPELEGMYAIAVGEKAVKALKEDGTSVDILTELDLNDNCFFTRVDYCAGKLYVAHTYAKEISSKTTKFPPVTTKTFETTNSTIYSVDLNQGDGNYEIELVYDYTPTKNVIYYEPMVYDNVIYFLENDEDVVQYNLATKEKTIIHDFTYKDCCSALKLDKESAKLYYYGQTEEQIDDGDRTLYVYDIKTQEEKMIAQGKLTNISQVTTEGVYYQINIDNEYYVKFYNIKEDTTIDMDDELRYQEFKVFNGNIYYFEETEDMGVYNLIVKTSDGTKKVLLDNFSYGMNDGIYIYGNSIQFVIGEELYNLDEENLIVLKQGSDVYSRIISVDNYSNINNNKVSKESNTEKISKEEAEQIAKSLFGEKDKETGNDIVYNSFPWIRDEEGNQYYVFNIKWNTGEMLSWIGTIGISFDGKYYRELNDPGYSLHSGDIQRDMYDIVTLNN